MSSGFLRLSKQFTMSSRVISLHGTSLPYTWRSMLMLVTGYVCIMVED